MRYRDIVDFEPIESVIQLTTANDREVAAQLVCSYVISDRLAEAFVRVILPQLQIDRPQDNKGLLIVGNYGTGKSHLLSVLSAVAQYPELASNLTHARVREAAGMIAGRFHVVRVEIGSTRRRLRAIILDALEAFFAQAGAPFTFPADDQITNNKVALIEALAAFTARYPEHGVLFVLDELLDYLRAQEERALMLDLSFLRELGEVAAATPFRFIAGLQESLFDNPRFGFVVEQIRRVRDRFEQVRIAREDIAFVVAHRLLRKTDSQIARISEHLRRFTPLYPLLADRLTEFARLYPIHPGYIETFERVVLAEKREVLKTFSLAIADVIDQEVAEDETGLISYDHYWGVLGDNPVLRSSPEVASVIQRSTVLEGLVQHAYTRPALRPMALRIIHALSVHRLTSELQAPVGVTAEELRDQLCLWTPALPEPTADFLLETIRTALREILRTVSGQYISFNAENGQYYLDLAKDIDFDAKIAERGEFMEERDLNRYYFDALQRVLHITTSTHVPNFQIWGYEVPWHDHQVMRPGYLFFGHPDERSTAQPPRDFYVYILPPFGTRAGMAKRQADEPDEVTFYFHEMDDAFRGMVRRYAGARALATESPQHRAVYEEKANQTLTRLIAWIEQHFVSHLRILHLGRTHQIRDVLAKMRSSESKSLEELVRLVAAQLLAPHFAATYPEYPAFTRLAAPITEASRANSAQDAIAILAGRRTTQLGAGVLEGLKLLDSAGRIRPLESPYARALLEAVQNKPTMQVVNREEVLLPVAPEVVKDPRFGLEPEWVVVALLALVHDGRVALVLGREALEADTLERAALLPLADLLAFRHFRRPRGIDFAAWEQIIDALGIPTHLLRDEGTREDAVRRLQDVVSQEVSAAARAEQRLRDGLRLWNMSLFTDALTIQVDSAGIIETRDPPEVRLSSTDLLPALRRTKALLEELARYNTPARLANLKLDESQIREGLRARATMQRIDGLFATLDDMQPLASYLATASQILPDTHPWARRAQAARDELLLELRRLARGEGALDLISWRRRLDALRQEYIVIYDSLHRTAVLGPADADRRARRERDPRLARLQQLAQIAIIHRDDLDHWAKQVHDLPACREYYVGLLEDSPLCPRCQYRPAVVGQAQAVQRLHALDEQLEALAGRWHAALRQNLASETAQKSRAAMRPAERRPIEIYLQADDPSGADLPAGFVAAANQALRGLRTVAIDAALLVERLAAGGLPCTFEELQQRFADLLRTTLAHHDARTTRFTIAERPPEGNQR